VKRKIFFCLTVILIFFVFLLGITILRTPFTLSLLPWMFQLVIVSYFAFYMDDTSYYISMPLACLCFSLFSVDPWGINVLSGVVLRLFVRYTRDSINHQFFLFPTLLILVAAHLCLMIDFIFKLVKGALFYSTEYLYVFFFSLIVGLFAPIIFKLIRALQRRMDA